MERMTDLEQKVTERTEVHPLRIHCIRFHPNPQRQQGTPTQAWGTDKRSPPPHRSIGILFIL